MEAQVLFCAQGGDAAYLALSRGEGGQNLIGPELGIGLGLIRSEVATERAIREANLGLNPQTDGQLIRVPIPDLTEERRRDLSRVAGKYAEAARIAVRHVRRDGMDTLKKLEKDNEMSQDDRHLYETEVQTLTDDHIAKIDAAFAAKEAEIMQV